MQSVHSCPIGRMLDPKAGFTILLPPIKSPRHRHSLARFHLAGCFFHLDNFIHKSSAQSHCLTQYSTAKDVMMH